MGDTKRGATKFFVSDDVNEQLLEELREFELLKAQGETEKTPSEIFKELHLKYESKNLTLSGVKNRYYKHVKGMFDEYKDEDSNKESLELNNTEEQQNTVIPNEKEETQQLPEEKKEVEQLPLEQEEKQEEIILVEEEQENTAATDENEKDKEEVESGMIVQEKSSTVTSNNTPKSLDDSITNYISTTQAKPQVKPKHRFKVGQLVDIQVNRIENYGVLVNTVDEYEQFGLLHISKIKRNSHISDLHDYFELGDIIKGARITKVERDGRIALTTYDVKIPLKPKEPLVEESSESMEYTESFRNTPFAQLSAVAETIQTIPAPPPVKEESQPVTPPPAPIEQEEVNEQPEPVPYLEKENGEIGEMKEYISGIVGALSPAANELFNEIAKKHPSVFKMTRSVLETEREFEPDRSLAFVQDVLKRLDDGL